MSVSLLLKVVAFKNHAAIWWFSNSFFNSDISLIFSALCQVRSLEESNRQLEKDIREIYAKRTSATGPDLSIYFNTIADLKSKVPDLLSVLTDIISMSLWFLRIRHSPRREEWSNTWTMSCKTLFGRPLKPHHSHHPTSPPTSVACWSPCHTFPVPPLEKLEWCVWKVEEPHSTPHCLHQFTAKWLWRFRTWK